MKSQRSKEFAQICRYHIEKQWQNIQLVRSILRPNNQYQLLLRPLMLASWIRVFFFSWLIYLHCHAWVLPSLAHSRGETFMKHHRTVTQWVKLKKEVHIGCGENAVSGVGEHWFLERVHLKEEIPKLMVQSGQEACIMVKVHCTGKDPDLISRSCGWGSCISLGRRQARVIGFVGDVVRQILEIPVLILGILSL